MNNMLKTGLLTLGLGIVFCPTDANAAVTGHVIYSNAVNNCQAFTPGPANTIRNRVIGAENVGAPIALACNFGVVYNGAPGQTYPTNVQLWFSNGGSAATVICTLRTGPSAGWSSGAAYTVAKSIDIGAGGVGTLAWSPADNPIAESTDLGNLVVGVNCTMPTMMTLGITAVVWSTDNGV